MPRNSRKILQSNYIHLILQGINGEYIFKKRELKEIFLNIVEEKIKESDINILSYCIMDNHVHILIYYKEIEELSKIMQKINTTYAMIYNKINKRKGFVFRDRFYTQPILNEKQLYNCLVYIHNNPIEAGICKKINEYHYSSYNEYKTTKRLINNKSIQLIFGSEKNYIEQFEYIHRNLQEIRDIKDVSENEYDVQDIIKKYKNRINGTLCENEIEFGNLLLEIRQKCGLSLRDMSEIFNISKDKLNKYIHKIIENQ